MATFADSLNALVADRDRQFIERIAKEYNLDVEELKSKYLEMPVKAPRKYTKKATKEPKSVTTVVVEDAGSKDKPCCTALTSKKEPCKFSALKGEVFCKRHLKQSLGESEPKETKAKKQTKAKKPDQPVHTHPLTETDEACDLCASHGNPLEETEQDFEVVTVAQRIEALLEEADDSESDEDETLGCDIEEFEEDDD
jgi:hypothetical protein